MSFKCIVFVASAFLIQCIAGQASSNCDCQSITISESGGRILFVSSVGPIAPSGIAVATELGLNGNLEVAGEVPYLSAVSFEGQFDTSGSAPVSYGCGDGCIAITQEIGNPSGNNAAVSSGLSTGSINSCGHRRS